MSQALIEQYTTEADQLKDYVARTLDGVEGRDLNEAELRTLTDAKSRIEKLNAQIDPLAAFEATKVSHVDLTAMETRAVARNRTPDMETRSMGDAFIQSDVFQGYPGRGTSSRVQYEGRALPLTLTGMASVLPDKTRVDLTPAPPPLLLLNLIDTIPVSQNAVETVVWAKTAGGAAVVAEGANKPSAEWGPTVASFTLDTIAVYTQLTRQLIEDAPAVAAKINTELSREVAAKQETEAAAALVAATIPATAGATLLAAIRTGVGIVQAAGYNPNAVLLNPADWATLDIDVFTRTLNGPVVGQTFWGLRPVSSNAQPAGTATVGDFSAGVQRYTRSGINLYVTDSHASTFIANIFTLLAEARAKTVVTRPAALVECTKTP